MCLIFLFNRNTFVVSPFSFFWKGEAGFEGRVITRSQDKNVSLPRIGPTPAETFDPSFWVRCLFCLLGMGG